MRANYLVSAVLLTGLLGGCYALSERPSGPLSSYTDFKNVKPPSFSPEELAQCPKPDGIFENNMVLPNSSYSYGLEQFFSVSGFQLPATNMPGGRSDDEPLPAGMSAIHLLGGIDQNGVRKTYTPSPGERFTLKIRPLTKPSSFKIVVHSSLGRTAEGEGVLRLYRAIDGTSSRRCENGALNRYYKSRLDSSLWVDPTTGDLLLTERDYQKPLDQGQLRFSARYKRIGN